MLEIKIRPPKEGECQACSGTGIVLPKDGEKRLVEVGRFCSECDEATKRWGETVRVMAEIDAIVAKRSPNSGPR